MPDNRNKSANQDPSRRQQGDAPRAQPVESDNELERDIDEDNVITQRNPRLGMDRARVDHDK